MHQTTTHQAPVFRGSTVDVGDRFYGALMGFVAGCHQSGVAPQMLLDSSAQPTPPGTVGLLWQSLPTLLLHYGHSGQASDSFESDLGILKEVAQVLYILMETSVSIEASAPQGCQPKARPQTSYKQKLRELPLSSDFSLLRQRLETGAFQWSVCFDSLINRSPALETSLTAPVESPAIAGAILGLWIGAAHGIRGIPLVQQFPLKSWKATIHQRAFQIFWQWAGSSQSDKVGVS